MRPSADSHAILIGVSAYEDPKFPPIRAARNSLTEMRQVLTSHDLCGWPQEAVTVISNPASATELAVRIAELAEQTTGVLLMYYVGHGALTPQAELSLTLTTTQRAWPKITGVTWTTVADALRMSPARVKISILDCCFAGQAIETALSANAEDSVGDIAHVEGVYTLTATERNRPAHVPPPDLQDTATTSFTGMLLEVIRAGIPGGPPELTLGDIYPVLERRLTAAGLPRPNQRGTQMAYQYVFTKNAAVQPAADTDDAGSAGGRAVGPNDGEFLVDLPENGQVVRDEDLPLRVEGRYSGGLRVVWVILEDSYRQYYVQNPPVRFQPGGTWRATNVLPGQGIMFVLFVDFPHGISDGVVDDNGRGPFDRMVQRKQFGGFQDLPPGSRVLESIEIKRV